MNRVFRRIHQALCAVRYSAHAFAAVRGRAQALSVCTLGTTAALPACSRHCILAYEQDLNMRNSRSHMERFCQIPRDQSLCLFKRLLCMLKMFQAQAPMAGCICRAGSAVCVHASDRPT